MIDPLLAAASPNAPPGLDPELRRALRTIEGSVSRDVGDAQIAA